MQWFLKLVSSSKLTLSLKTVERTSIICYYGAKLSVCYINSFYNERISEFCCKLSGGRCNLALSYQKRKKIQGMDLLFILLKRNLEWGAETQDLSTQFKIHILKTAIRQIRSTIFLSHRFYKIFLGIVIMLQ